MKKPSILEIKPSRHFPFVARHPWAHSASITDARQEMETGDVVDLVTHDGTWIARGLFNGNSKIRVRLYSWDPGEVLDDAFFLGRIDQAIERRQRLAIQPHLDAVRLVFSEADGISGLIVDRYGDFLVVHVTSAAIATRIDGIVEHLRNRLGPQATIVRVDEATAKAEGLDIREDVLHGAPPPPDLCISENGIRYTVDLLHSQKTGLYLDQRENRHVSTHYVRGEVLDVCCYVGAFALNVARSPAVQNVTGIDTSQKAIALANTNARLNELDNISFEQGDCFAKLESYKHEQRTFDSIILDPPRFAGTRKSYDAAVRAYSRLNQLAIDLLRPHGTLVTCSCSGRVSRPDFMKILSKAGQRTARDLIVFESRGAAADHPVRLSCPETDYLKCVIAEVH